MRYLAALILALALIASGAAQTAEIDFGRYHALVIGINDYEHLPRLETAVNDASAVHDVLRREYGYRSRLLLNPSRDDLMRALDVLRAELTENDNLLIFYAGHGYLDRPTNEGFWLPADAQEDSQVEWVPVSVVTRLLRATTAKHALVVADSCYSGTLARDAPVLLAVGSDREVELRRIAGKRARKALTSGGLEPVADGGGDGHSVFTRALLEALRGNREVLDGYQLYRTLRRSVVLNAEQTPQYSDIRFAGDEGGDFLFVPVALARARPTAPPPEPAARQEPSETAIEVLFWQSIQGSETAADYEAYLGQYPSGKFAALAKSRIATLGATTSVATPVVPPEPEQPKPSTVALEPVEATYVAVKRANVRAEPTIDATKTASLPAGTEVYVPGRTTDGKWFRVERDDAALGYVYAPLLQERGAWRQARRELEEAEWRRPDKAEREVEERARSRAEAEREAAESARRRAAAERRWKLEEARLRAEERAAQERAAQERAAAAELERQASVLPAPKPASPPAPAKPPAGDPRAALPPY